MTSGKSVLIKYVNSFNDNMKYYNGEHLSENVRRDLYHILKFTKSIAAEKNTKQDSFK